MKVATTHRTGNMEITATTNKIGRATRAISTTIQTIRVAIRVAIKVVMVITVVSNSITRGSQITGSNSNKDSSVAIAFSHISSDPISKTLDKIQAVSIVINHPTVADTGANIAEKKLLFYTISIYTTFPLIRTQDQDESAKTNQFDFTFNE